MIAGKQIMKHPKGAYRSYLLRLWQVKQNGEWDWRASLEEVETGKRWIFINLEMLFSFLQAEPAESSNAYKE
jgi:hypothetical protein